MKLGRAEFIRWYKLLGQEMNRLKDDARLLKENKSLIVMGSEDHVFLGKAKQALRGLGSGIRLTVMKNCGHVCSLQNAKEFNRITLKFLQATV